MMPENKSFVIETLKNMYIGKKVDISSIRKMLTDKKITNEEYEYIVKR